MNTLLNTFSFIQLQGDKAQEFLQGQLTCDMNQFTDQKPWSLAASCDHKGRMVANFWVLKRQDDFLLILPRDLETTVIEHLTKYAVFSKVTVKPGPSDLVILEVDSNTKNALKSEKAVIISLPNANRHLAIIDKSTLKEIEAKTDETQWIIQNIQDGLCILTLKTSLLFTPQMINLQLQGGVSFEKGCYVGQEIIARTQHLGKLKRHLYRINLDSNDCPTPGDALKNDQGESVGVIVTAIKYENNSVDALAVIQDRVISSLEKSNHIILKTAVESQ